MQKEGWQTAVTGASATVPSAGLGLDPPTATRSEVLPDVPTVGDFVPGYEASALQGIGAPKNTPAEIVDKLSRTFHNVSLH
jgi:hypothetical protein